MNTITKTFIEIPTVIRRASFLSALLSGALFLAGGARPAGASDPFYDLPPISYSTGEPDNAVSVLEEALRSGDRQLPRGSGQGKAFLEALLAELGVPVESQVLVFSKTSKQNSLIGPSNPRALYFSEDCYVGWVPGGAVEIACYEPNLGPVFYLTDPRPETSPNPVFVRDNSCLSCHTRNNTRDIPGVMVRSVYPAESGEPIFRAGTFLTGPESPFEERWGGWYVTGRHGSARHMGNVFAQVSSHEAEIDRDAGANVESLEGRFDTSRYLRPGSDIVALMVLEHQTFLHNLLTESSFRVRDAIHRYAAIAEALGEPPPDERLTGSALSVATSQAEKLVKSLLFCDEVALPPEGIEGDPAFTEGFRRNRREDPNGRSLKDFDLSTRLFQYRCSYMIHSASFDALPPQLGELVYRRLWEVLSGRDESGDFSHLGALERRRIIEILRATKPGLPAYWHED